MNPLQNVNPDPSQPIQDAMAAVDTCLSRNPGGGNQIPSQDPKVGLPGDVNAPVKTPDSSSD